jgi:hypothetical protein
VLRAIAMKSKAKHLLPKRKKDFKLREDIVAEFERYAPSGKQTAIVEHLIASWVLAQKLNTQRQEMRRVYDREKNK